MNATNDKIPTLSIKELLSSDEYVIPRYQRNYAWGVTELKQLFQDVADYAVEHADKNYYIGTLVVFPYQEGMNMRYETIDGQQRLTTLNLILCAMKNELAMDDIDWFTHVNISFEYRERSNYTLEMLYRYLDLGNMQNMDVHMCNVFSNCKSIFYNVVNGVKGLTENQFWEYFFNKVKILRVVVPNTDRNHYFEVMNSRGVQLEMSEILKARLMDVINRNAPSGTCVYDLASNIWQACSMMDRYVQTGFAKDERNSIFGADGNTHFGWASYQDLFQTVANGSRDMQHDRLSILDILQGKSTEDLQEVATDSDVDMYTPIINFPNLLLIVLQLCTKEDVVLNDKQLLSEFDRILAEKEDKYHFILEFLFTLLKTRFLLDSFIMKREYFQDKTNNWYLRRIKYAIYNKKIHYSYVNSFSDDSISDSLIKIQSMFHVSYPAQQHKYWLYASLKYLNENYNDRAEVCIDGKAFVGYLEKLARRFVCDRYLCRDDDKQEFYDIITHIDFERNRKIKFDNLDKGTSVEHFMFNYMDYLLWKENPEIYQNFEFSFRTSVEHFYPRTPITGRQMDDTTVNKFGNLCLISSSFNSRLNNLPPTSKYEYFKHHTTLESIKQKVMMEYVKQQGDWDEFTIKDHDEKVKELLKRNLGGEKNL